MESFGLTDKQNEWLKKNIIAPIKEQGAKVYFFGSRANGTHSKFSDIDLMVESNKDLSKLIFNLRELAEESNFPFKVDLVLKSEFNPSYLESYDKNKVEV